MKYSITAAALVGAVMAQQLGSLPQCAQNCVNSMTTNVAQSLGCTPGDAACLCSKANFAYGIRDCSAQACPPGTDQVQISTFIAGYCAAANAGGSSSAQAATSVLGGAASSGSSAVASATSGVRSAVAVVPVYSINTMGGSTMSSIVSSSTIFAGQASAVSTSGTAVVYAVPIFATIASNGMTSLSTGTSTITGVAAGAATSAASSALSSASGAAASASSSAASVASSASAAASSVGSSASRAASSVASSVASGASSAVGSATSAAASVTSRAGAPMVTMAANGFVAAGGLAAFMLL